MSEPKNVFGSGSGLTLWTLPLSSWPAKASTRILDGLPLPTRSTIDSWTLVFARIWVMSGRLKIFCRSRTVAPSSICTWLLPPKRPGSFA